MSNVRDAVLAARWLQRQGATEEHLVSVVKETHGVLWTKEQARAIIRGESYREVESAVDPFNEEWAHSS